MSCSGVFDTSTNSYYNQNGCTVPLSKSAVAKTSGLPFIYASIDTLFGKFVSADRGLVDYCGIHADSLLRELKDSIADFNMSILPNGEDSLAFWINAYNVMVIYHLAEFGFATPQDQLGFPLFSKSIIVGGDTTTLDSLEKIGPAPIAQFGDPRTHFALVCAAYSCPPLLNRAYRGDSLYAQLDKRANLFLNMDELNDFSSSPKVSVLFDWYSRDFENHVRDTSARILLTDSAGANVKDFISGYLSSEQKKAVLTSGTLSFKAYDWTINKQ